MLSNSMPMLSYEGAASPAARLDARFKVVVAVMSAGGIIVAGNARQFAALAGLILIFLVGARVPVLTVWSNLKPVFVFLIVGGGLIALSSGGEGWTFGFAHISRVGLMLAGRLSVQLLLLLAVTTVMTYSTSPLAIANALRRLFGFLRYIKVPVEDMATMLTLAITFIPIMSQEVDRQLTARAARGANPRRFGIWTMLGEMLVPLIQSNLQRGEELALALDTRMYGYGARTHRSDADTAGGASLLLFFGTAGWVAAALLLL